MKKTISILLLVLLIAGVIISCDNKVNNNINETVSISFNNLSSRAISSSVENFDAKELYWKYSAKKNSADNNPNLNSGATSSNYATDEAGAVKIGKGLNATLSGFSQGLWDFKLFAYKDPNYENLAYGGEAKGVRLEWGKDNVVNVEVSPFFNDKDTGTIDLSKLTFECSGTPITNWSIRSVSYNNTTLDESSISGKELTVTPGTYSITITIKNEDAPLTVYDSCTLEQITVYSNLKTTVTGSITLSLTPPPELNDCVIYYDAGDNGQTYTFYDSNNNKIEYTGNSISELQNAKYYTVSGNRAEGKGDRFFVVYNKLLYTEDDKVYWGFFGKSFGETNSTNKSGKSNTTTILKFIKENDLLNPDNPSSTSVYKNCGTGNYLWDLLIDFNNNNPTGFNDWYIPSDNEMWNLKNNYSELGLSFSGTKYYKTSTAGMDSYKEYIASDLYSNKINYTKKTENSDFCLVMRSF